ncbi:Ig-like domain-containing protein [Leptospira santarosai]|uniref:Ig-like domain-containing protein n=1 Tax=Leptospira santarosai TaxID=28183 RepID=UPI0002C015B5|nr:Ig-like domain-containing protein [Leptospira santarosai]EMP01622.1 FG-GAP repeat protein [Leptospira santarosai str. HAI1380]
MGCVQGGKSSGIPFLAYLDFGNRAPSANSFNVFQISPGPNVTGVSLNTSIQVGFSQKLDPSTIQSQTIQLTQGNSVIAGSLTSTEKTLLFNPTSALAASKVYTVRVSKDIKSEGGSSLSEDYVWNFTTGAVLDAIAPDLSLRTPAINATLVPNTTSVQVALTETMDCTSVNGGTLSLKNTTTGFYEAGPVACVGSVITFTPTLPLSFNTTYRVDLSSTAKDLANNTLANSYNWNFTTGPGPDAVPPTVSFISPAPNSLNVPVNSAVSIAFSEPINCGTVGNIVLHNTTLAAGTTVGVGVACANTATTLTPAVNLDPNTTYSVIFSNAVTDLGGGNGLNPVPAPSTFTTAAAPVVDNTPPTVTSKVPAAAATGVGLNTIPMAVFSEPMNCASVNTASFRLKETGSPTYLNGSVQCSGTSATWTPDATNPLAANTQYTVEVTAAAVDASTSNNALNPPVVGPLNLWNFTTGPGLDTIRPNVVVVTPENGASGVSINGGANIAFSETIDCPNIGGNIVLDDEPTFALPNIAINITCNGNTASFTPAAALAFNTPYYAKIKSTVTDTATNSMNADYVWSFTTGVVADSTAPQISLSAPASGATGIPTNATITVAFNESINCSTLNLTVDNFINGTTTCSGSSATFTPDALTPLSASTTYTVTVAAGLKDIAGNTMTASSWNFTTGAAADTVAPTVTIQNLREGITAGAGATGVEGSIVESGFVIGTAADARGIATIEVNIDSIGWTSAGVSGTTSWKYQLPNYANTWRLGSLHTIRVRATDTSNNVTTSAMITVRKGTNKDINGDGYVDLVTSEYGQGIVYLFYSSGTGGITITDATAASHTIVGIKADFFGKTVASGDFNGDGFADIAVGAPKSNTDGKVFIFHSAGTQGINTSFYAFANTILVGDGASEQFGASLATGDISGDRYTDLVVGAPAYSTSKGRIYLFYSQGAAGIATADAVTDATTTCVSGCTYLRGGMTNNDKFGFSLAVGNINGGIYDDIAVGAPGHNGGVAIANNGRVYVYYGDGSNFTATTPNTIDNIAVTTYPNGIYSQFGYSVAVADFNEDNYDDLAVGAPEYAPDATGTNQKGKVCIFTSSTATGIGNILGMGNATRYITGDNAGDQIGTAITARDLDLDGRADLITSTHTSITAMIANNWNNSAVFLTPRNGTIGGTALLSNKSYQITGIGGYVPMVNGPGKPLSTGDVNGDGIPDLIIGRPNAPVGISNRISIFHLPTGTGQPADLNNPTINILGTSLTSGMGGGTGDSNQFGAAFY